MSLTRHPLGDDLPRALVVHREHDLLHVASFLSRRLNLGHGWPAESMYASPGRKNRPCSGLLPHRLTQLWPGLTAVPISDMVWLIL